MREVKLLQSIRHDNVICLLDVFHVRRRLYLVFEYIEGTVLQVRLRKALYFEPNRTLQESSI